MPQVQLSTFLSPLRCAPVLLALSSGPALAQATDLEWRSIVTQGQSQDVRIDSLNLPPSATVMGRYRQDYVPIGGRIGNFFLYPRMSVAEEATDNLYASNIYRTSDLTTRLNGRVLLTSSMPRHALDFQVFASQSLHARHGTEDVTNYGGVIDGRLDFGASTALTMVVSAERGTLDRSDFTSPANALKPVSFNRYYGEAKAQHTFNRLQISGSVKLTKLEYSNTIARDGTLIDQQFRNGDFLTYQAGVSYRLRSGIRIITSGTYTVARYDLPLSEALKPNSLDRSSHKKRIEAGLRFDFTDRLVGSLRGGWIDVDYADPRLRSFNSPVFSADLVWSLRRATTLQLKADRRVDENTSTTSAGVRVTEGSLSLEHELRPNLLLGARGSYADMQTLGLGASRQMLTGGAQVRYLMNRRLSFVLDLLRQRRTSPNEEWRFDENRVMIQAHLTL